MELHNQHVIDQLIDGILFCRKFTTGHPAKEPAQLTGMMGIEAGRLKTELMALNISKSGCSLLLGCAA